MKILFESPLPVLWTSFPRKGQDYNRCDFSNLPPLGESWALARKGGIKVCCFNSISVKNYFLLTLWFVILLIRKINTKLLYKYHIDSTMSRCFEIIRDFSDRVFLERFLMKSHLIELQFHVYYKFTM